MITASRKERRRTSKARMCKRKKPFQWKDEADQYMKELQATNVEGSDRLDVFNCLYCFGWHVGHTPKTKVTF